MLDDIDERLEDLYDRLNEFCDGEDDERTVMVVLTLVLLSRFNALPPHDQQYAAKRLGDMINRHFSKALAESLPQ